MFTQHLSLLALAIVVSVMQRCLQIISAVMVTTFNAVVGNSFVPQYKLNVQHIKFITACKSEHIQVILDGNPKRRCQYVVNDQAVARFASRYLTRTPAI